MEKDDIFDLNILNFIRNKKLSTATMYSGNYSKK